MRRFWLLLPCAALLYVGSGTAIGGLAAASDEPTDEVQIEYWHFYGGGTGEAVEAVVEMFNEEHSGEIVVDAVFQGTQDDMLAKVRAAAAGGGLPHVVAARESDVTQYADADLVVPLEDYVQDPELGLSADELADIYPGVLARTSLEVWDDKTLAWPFANSAAAWFYNVDLLREAGFEDPPASWSDLAEVAGALAADVPAWVLRDDVGPWFIVVLWTFGVPWLSDDGLTPNFDNETSIEALTLIQGMVDDGTLVVSDTAVEDFIAGRGAMTMLSSGFMGRFADEITTFEWGVTVPPVGPGAEPITEMFGTIHAIFEGTPEEQQAAWRFLQYMNSPEIQAEFAAQTGFFPSTSSSEDLPVLQEFSADVPQFQAALDSIAPNMELLPQSPALNEVRNVIATEVVTELVLGQLTPEDAAAKLQFEAERALAETG